MTGLKKMVVDKFVEEMADSYEMDEFIVRNIIDHYHRQILSRHSSKQEPEPLAVLCQEAYETSKSKGFKHDNDSQAIALMHSELSEALEFMRHPEKKDEHLPELNPIGLEMADVCIRVFDFCGARNIDLAGCVKAKMEYNKSRPFKHGNKAF